MTRRLRYASHLDETYFASLVLSAARSYCGGVASECAGHLQSAFDVLAQERSRYFPIDAQFVDLMLTAPTTLGPSLSAALGSEHPLGLLLTGELLAEIEARNPTVGL